MVSVAAGPVKSWQPVDGMAAPTASFIMEGGNARSLADFKDQVVVLNLWATWCTPCLVELPTLDKLEETYAARGLVVIPLSLDTIPFEQLRKFLDEKDLELPHLAQDTSGDFRGALVKRGVPVTYLLDRDGKLVARYEGDADWLAKPQTDKIEKLLTQ